MREQTWIPGTQPEEPVEPNVPAVVARIDAWLAAKAAQARAAETARIRHESLLAELAEHGLERHPYVDERTGRKRYVVADRTPRARTVNAPKPPKQREVSDKPPRQDADQVEHRKRSRKAVEAELAEREAEVKARDEADDPFAGARAALDGALQPRRDEDDTDAASSDADDQGEDPRPSWLREKTEAREAQEQEPAPVCGLRYGKAGAACSRAWKHEGDHDNGSNKWKARPPRKPLGGGR